MLAVNYAFSGTELIGIAAGETKNPEQVIPKAIKATLWRLVIFFIGTMVIISILIPSYQGKSYINKTLLPVPIVVSLTIYRDA